MADKFFSLDININKLTKSEREVYFYLIKNRPILSMLTSSKVAKDCFTTTTTVNRLCKKMGLEGYSDIKTLARIYENTEFSYQSNVDNNTYNSIYLNFDIDKNEIASFCENLDKEKEVYLFASGSSVVTATYFYRVLLRLGYKARIIEDNYLLEKIMEHQLIIISNSGATTSCLSTAVIANYKDVKLFSITTFKSHLYNMSNHTASHNILVETFSSIEHEQQIHLMRIVNDIIHYLVEVMKVND